MHDLRYAARVLRRSPGFTATAALVLAIGIGANSAMFSLVDAVLLRPLPYHRPAELVMLWENSPGHAHNPVSPLNFLDWSEQNKVFSFIAAVAGASPTLTRPNGAAERIPGQAVTRSFFELLGVRPVAGRLFSNEDIRQKGKVVVLSERLWRNRFAADRDLVGRPITLDGTPVTVVGVVPAEFQIFFKADLWIPFVPVRSPEQRRMHYLQVLGRLKPGVSMEQASLGMGLVAADIARISPETNKNWGITIEPLRNAIVGRDLRVTSLLLIGVVAFILLMACANIANLLLARAAGRTREIAVRASLGGSRSRIVRQLLTESALLSVAGGVIGVLMAWSVIQASPALLPPGTLPAGITLALDARVIVFAVGVTLMTGLLFGLAPAWQAARIPLSEVLRAGGRGIAGGAVAFRSGLAVAEIALALMLVSGAGLLVRTLGVLSNVDPGYRAERVLTFRMGLPLKRYPTLDRVLAFHQAAERELSSIPGVESAALGSNLPLDGWDIGQGVTIVGDPPIERASTPSAHYQMVSTRYFETLGIPIIQGRAFTTHDTSSSTQVCVVNEEFVRKHLKGRNPLGMRISIAAMDSAGPKDVIREIVGVSRQVKVQGLGEKENTVEVYVPMAQNMWYSSVGAIRSAGDPLALVPAVTAAIAKVDKDLPLTRIRTMQEVASESIAQPRFRAGLVTAFASLSLVHAAVGIFGVLAFSVAQRTREFGIRMALGARTGSVVRLVVSGALKIIGLGLVIGLAGAAFLTRSLSALLYGVRPFDPVTFVAAPAMLAAVALLACALPAFRAASVVPSEALRND